jgi:predicted XRE-type DNA-binding protein
MTGRKKFETLKQHMGADRIREIEGRTKSMLVEMVLSEVRKRSGLTQQEVADLLGISQPGLSKMEQQDDMQIGTLSKLVEAMGGSIEIIAHFPFGDCKLTQFDGSKIQASPP